MYFTADRGIQQKRGINLLTCSVSRQGLAAAALPGGERAAVFTECSADRQAAPAQQTRGTCSFWVQAHDECGCQISGEQPRKAALAWQALGRSCLPALFPTGSAARRWNLLAGILCPCPRDATCDKREQHCHSHWEKASVPSFLLLHLLLKQERGSWADV